LEVYRLAHDLAEDIRVIKRFGLNGVHVLHGLLAWPTGSHHWNVLHLLLTG
jgi:hypothetical protein